MIEIKPPAPVEVALPPRRMLRVVDTPFPNQQRRCEGERVLLD